MNTTTMNEKVSFATSCECTVCRECSIFYSAQSECDECGGELENLTDCGGECYEDAFSYWERSILPEWLANVGEPDCLKISGTHMGWEKLSAFIHVESFFPSLYSVLTTNGDYSLTFTIEGDLFKVTRRSHDEPTGADFVVSPCTTDHSQD